jgi:SHS2 domain-containing protein
LFANAAAGLCALMVDPAAVRERSADELAVDLPGAPADELLREFLAEILFRFHARKRVASRAEVVVSPGSVRGRLHGEEYDRARHGGRIEVKGATFHALGIERTEAGLLEATVVFDV